MRLAILAASVCLTLFCVPDLRAADDETVQALKRTSAAFTRVGKEAMHSIVFIDVAAGVEKKKKDRDSDAELENELYEYFFRERGRRMPHPDRQGTGFIVSEDGYILTNAHIVDGGGDISVKLHDKRVFDAELVGSDNRSDVALLKIDGADFPAVSIGDSREVEIGDWAIAIGNPFGLAETLTVGVISAIGRSGVGITEYENFIQTDAAINPGNSGGPLLNIDGEVIGMNTAIFSRSGGFMGVGFTLPINMAMNIKDQFIEYGKIRRGFLGVVIDDLTERKRKALKMDRSEGVYVVEVQPDSAADDAGLKEADVILQINSNVIKSVAGFRARVALMPPGSKLEIELFRDGAKTTLTAVTGIHPDEKVVEKKETPKPKETVTDSPVGPAVGLTVKELDAATAEKLELAEDDGGVLITEVTDGTSAEKKGLEAGKVIVSVNRKRVETLEAYHKALKRSETTGVVLLRVRNEDHYRFVTLTVPEELLESLKEDEDAQP